MKILFVCENYYPHYGGAEVLFKNLAEGFVKEGHRVAIVTTLLPGTKRFEEINDVKVHRVSCFNNRYLFSFFSIPKVWKLAQKADIIQTTTFNGAPPAWLGARLTGKPVVLTVHEVWIGKWKEVTGFSGVKAILHDLLERTLYLLPFNRYICVSNATRKDLLRQRISQNKTVTIYNGFDYEFWDSKNFSTGEVKKIRQNLKAENKFVCFSWGRPGASKGFQHLIKAAPYIKEKVPNAMILLMLGTKEKYKKNYQQLKRLASKYPEIIKIIPSVPYQHLGTMIKAADCIIVPSLAEGFGYSVLEANSLNKPVVASDAGSLPEVISGKYQIFKSKNAINLAEKVYLASEGIMLYRKQKKYLWDNTIFNYLDIYRSQIKEQQD